MCFDLIYLDDYAEKCGTHFKHRTSTMAWDNSLHEDPRPTIILHYLGNKNKAIFRVLGASFSRFSGLRFLVLGAPFSI